MPATTTTIREPAATSIALIERSGAASLREIGAGHFLETLAGPGVVVLRGFHTELEEFEAFTRSLCTCFHRVAARDKLRDARGDGFTAKAPERNFTLLAHSEGTYRPFKEPDLAFFYCLVPPESPGGEALAVDGRLFLERLPPSIRSRIETQDVVFEAYWEPERWQAEFGIDNPSEFAAIAKQYPGLACEFDGEYMRYRCRHSAIQPDAQGWSVFSNAILAHLPAVRHDKYRDARVYTKESNRVYFGDGEALPIRVVNTLIDIQDQVAHAHRLQRHDLLVLDNSRVMHGRRPMKRDGPRVLLTRFGHLREELRWGGRPVAA